MKAAALTEQQVLVAEDDPVSRRLIVATLQKWGYAAVVTENGTDAWAALEAGDGPRLAILDWMMPGMDGPEVCRRIRESTKTEGTYVILLTARAEREDLLSGLASGADDFITKPFDRAELRARVGVGSRILGLQCQLAGRVQELEAALARVKQLQGLLPICSYCKRIRNDHDYWQKVETYISEHSEAQFSHGICPDCFEKIVKPDLERFPGKVANEKL